MPTVFIITFSVHFIHASNNGTWGVKYVFNPLSCQICGLKFNISNFYLPEFLSRGSHRQLQVWKNLIEQFGALTVNICPKLFMSQPWF